MVFCRCILWNFLLLYSPIVLEWIAPVNYVRSPGKQRLYKVLQQVLQQISSNGRHPLPLENEKANEQSNRCHNHCRDN